MAYPKAQIMPLSPEGIMPVRYEETEHYQVTKRFVNDHKRMLEILMQPGNRGGTNMANVTEKTSNPTVSNAAKAGIGFGTALAITISWSIHHSIFWAIVHGLLS